MAPYEIVAELLHFNFLGDNMIPYETEVYTLLGW